MCYTLLRAAWYHTLCSTQYAERPKVHIQGDPKTWGRSGKVFLEVVLGKSAPTKVVQYQKLGSISL